jgi:hypothetical protein
MASLNTTVHKWSTTSNQSVAIKEKKQGNQFVHTYIVMTGLKKFQELRYHIAYNKSNNLMRELYLNQPLSITSLNLKLKVL